jgi:hypothetical protein
MDAQPGPSVAARPARHDDVDRSRGNGAELPQCSRASMTESRALPTCKHRREPARLLCERVVAYRVDPTVYSVQASRLYPTRDPVRSDPDRDELRERNHSVLARGDLSDQTVGWGGFVSHSDKKPPSPGGAPERTARGAGLCRIATRSRPALEAPPNGPPVGAGLCRIATRSRPAAGHPCRRS